MAAQESVEANTQRLVEQINEDYSDVVILGAGLAGLLAAAMLPGSTLVGVPGNIPPYNLEVYEPLASWLGYPAEEEVKGRFHYGDVLRTPAPIQSSKYFQSSVFWNLWRGVDEGKDYRHNNTVWGDAGRYLTGYNDKKLGLVIDGKYNVDTFEWQLDPELWRPPDRRERYRQWRNPQPTKRSLISPTQLQDKLLTIVRGNGASAMPHNAAKIAGSGVSDSHIEVQLEGGGAVEGKRLVSTVPAFIMETLAPRKSGLDFSEFRHSGVVTIYVRGTELKQHYDTIATHDVAAQRVTHNGVMHSIEVPIPHGSDWQDKVEEWVQQCGQLGVLGDAWTVVNSKYSPMGYPYMTARVARQWKQYREVMAHDGIHLVGRWSAWDQSYTTHVFQKIQHLKRYWMLEDRMGRKPTHLSPLG